MSITLYDLAAADPAVRFSPFCWRTRFCLLHKALAFETVPWRFMDKPALAPSKQDRVPVIIDGNHGSHWVHDSWQIALYLDREYPDRPPLMPTAADRTAARLVAVWAETAVHAAAFPLIIGNLFANLDAEDKPYFRQNREERFGKSLEAIVVAPTAGLAALARALAPAEQALGQAPFLGGDRPTYADYALAGSLMWIWATAPVAPFDDSTAVGRWFGSILDLFDGHARKAAVMR